MQMRSDKRLAAKRGRGGARVMLVALACLTAPALGDAKVRIELPAAAAGHTVYWALQQSGAEDATGSLSVAAADEVRELALPASEGQATLHAVVNRDQYASYVASFGDLFQQVSFEVHDGNATVVLSRVAWQERTLTAPDNLLTIH